MSNMNKIKLTPFYLLIFLMTSNILSAGELINTAVARATAPFGEVVVSNPSTVVHQVCRSRCSDTATNVIENCAKCTSEHSKIRSVNKFETGEAHLCTVNPVTYHLDRH